MKSLLLIIILMPLCSWGNLRVVENAGGINARDYLKDVIVPTQEGVNHALVSADDAISSGRIELAKLIYPAKSTMSYGVVNKHRLYAHFGNLPIFIIGSDDQSVRWLLINAKYLKASHAIGIITNVTSEHDVHLIEQKAHIHLVAQSIQGLDRIIGTNHYPVLIQHGWVVQ